MDDNTTIIKKITLSDGFRVGIKNLDKITHRTFLKKYPEFEWKKAMGMRDIISHHYFDLNSEVVTQVCKEEIPKLNKVIKKILNDHSF